MKFIDAIYNGTAVSDFNIFAEKFMAIARLLIITKVVACNSMNQLAEKVKITV